MFFTAGMAFLGMAKAKNVLRGYTAPKPFDISETERCIDYDKLVIADWLQALARYAGSSYSLAGKNILELGPGSDLGIGVLLLAAGARKYNACDVNNLVARTPPSFYESLLATLPNGAGQPDLQFLRAQLQAQRSGEPSLLNYVVKEQFDLVAACGTDTIDLVFSQAAFEHFDDIDDVVRQLTAVCRAGAIIVAEIDLKTHSRWVRDKDPNNIYRYPDTIYNAFWFRGAPNRVRPYQYSQAFERHGWTNVQIVPRTQLQLPPALVADRFSGEHNQMQYLTVVLSATKGGAGRANGAQ